MSLILSVQMLLGWIGDIRTDRTLTTVAQKVEAVVISTLEEGRIRTPNLGGTLSTKEFGDAIVDKLKSFEQYLPSHRATDRFLAAQCSQSLFPSVFIFTL